MTGSLVQWPVSRGMHMGGGGGGGGVYKFIQLYSKAHRDKQHTFISIFRILRYLGQFTRKLHHSYIIKMLLKCITFASL